MLTSQNPSSHSGTAQLESRPATTAPAEATSRPGRLPQLDVLRAVAILLVLGAHPLVTWQKAGPLWPAARAWVQVSWTGVNLFFVLSGFLIGGLLFAEIRATGSLNVRQFMIRRAFKIWPAYYVYLLLLAYLCLKLGPPEGISVADLVPFLVHVQNYFGRLDLLGPHTWSLAVEEHFYLALPLLLALVLALVPKLSLGTRRRGWTAAAPISGFIVLAIVCAWLRFLQGDLLPLILTHLCIDSLGFGVLLAFLFHYHPSTFERIARHRVLLMFGGLCLVALASAPGRTPDAWGYALIPVGLYLGYGAILVAMMAMPLARFQSWPLRALTLVGFYSYSIYLWHVDIAYRLLEIPRDTEWAKALPGWLLWALGMSLYVLLAVGTGVLMSRCIEMPALALRDRLFPRKAKLIAGDATVASTRL